MVVSRGARTTTMLFVYYTLVAECLACWTQVTVLGKLFTPIVPLFTKQQN